MPEGGGGGGGGGTTSLGCGKSVRGVARVGTNSGACALSRLKETFLERDGSVCDSAIDEDGEVSGSDS